MTDFNQSINELIDDYLKGLGSPCDANNVIKFYSTLSVKDAIITACDYGKVIIDGEPHWENHFKRIDINALKEAEQILLRKEKDLSDCKNFIELFLLLREVTRLVDGVGPMFYYDVSLRIAAAVGKHCLPEDVFYQRGAEVGAMKLGILRKPSEEEPWLPYSLFTRNIPPFERLKPYEIEDFLCLYKDKLDFANA